MNKQHRQQLEDKFDLKSVCDSTIEKCLLQIIALFLEDEKRIEKFKSRIRRVDEYNIILELQKRNETCVKLVEMIQILLKK